MHNRNKILLVEDEKSLANDVINYLNENNYKCTHTNKLSKARDLIKINNYDAVLLDLGLPDGDGLSLINNIKNNDSSCGVIIISAKDAVDKKVEGLELGADDYIGKPFEPKELLLRINNIISKKVKIDVNKNYTVGEASINFNKMIIKLNNAQRKINITEKKILMEMLSNPGKTYSRSRIGELSGILQERSIDVMITRLRQKIERDPKNPKYLQTIRGSGYVLWIE